MYEIKFEDGSEITSYLATGYAEGFEQASNERDVIKAWSYLIGTKLVYGLQGWFGRTAQAFINAGYIDVGGTVDWELINDKLMV